MNTPPQPLPDADTTGFWEATAEGHLAVCHCQECGLWMMPPLERCRQCAGPTAFDPIAGTGTLYSFIVQHHRSVPGYFDQLPYVVGLMEIDEQIRVRIPGRVVGIEHGDVKCGLRVRAELVPLAGGDFMVPVLRPFDAP
ncbi:MAG: OB-fold domain-containing protein [Actinomycetota bacterium]